MIFLYSFFEPFFKRFHYKELKIFLKNIIEFRIFIADTFVAHYSCTHVQRVARHSFITLKKVHN